MIDQINNQNKLLRSNQKDQGGAESSEIHPSKR